MSNVINPVTDRRWLVLSDPKGFAKAETADPQPIISAISQQTPGGATDAMGSCTVRMLKAGAGQESKAMLLFTEGENKPDHFRLAEVTDAALRGGLTFTHFP